MVVIIDYGAGNLTSVRLALEELGVDAEISDCPRRVRGADRVVFPGVGAVGAAMERLRNSGLDEVVREIVARGTPFLGICLGMQIAFEHSEEDGGVDTLGLIPGCVRRFRPRDRAIKVPHMGWNSVRQTAGHSLFEGIADGSEFYFVHSYFPVPADPSLSIGRTDYAGVTFASVVARGNFVATQFHPEKSGRVGLRMLRNFLQWQGV